MGPPTKRQFLQSAVVAVIVPLAGCSLIGGGNDSEPDASGQNGGASSPHPREEMGSVRKDSVDGLDIVGWRSTIEQEESEIVVTITVQNTGEATADTSSYGYFLYLYQDDGEEFPREGTSVLSGRDTDVSPGGTAELRLVRSVENPDAIGSYGVALYCTQDGDGIYCG